MNAFIANPLPSHASPTTSLPCSLPSRGAVTRRARHTPRAETSPARRSDIPLSPVRPHDKAGLPTTAPSIGTAAAQSFASFFSAMPGSWNSQRTYHYVMDDNCEPSQTTFDVKRLSMPSIEAVLRSNADNESLTDLPEWCTNNTHGFRVDFNTRMGSDGRYVRAGTNLAFVPTQIGQDGVLHGSYYRDLGYEEKAPIKSVFVFDCNRMTLVMTTFYTKVVSVDQISLINPNLRLRNIVTYTRPPDGQALEEVILVGFGVEKKGQDQRLVK